MRRHWRQALAWLGGGVIALAVWLAIPPLWPGPEGIPLRPKGVKHTCQIQTDRHQVPHVDAPNHLAAFYCWGRLHARARAWQMDYFRRLGRGRLAEWSGRLDHIKRDFSMRLLGLPQIAARWTRHLKQHHPQRHRLFAYYTWGVNDEFAKIRAKGSKHYAHKAIGFDLRPWRISDSMIVLLLQSLSMTQMAFRNDLKHARLRLHLGSKRYQQLYGPDQGMSLLNHSIIRPGEHPLAPYKIGFAPPKVPAPKGSPAKMHIPSTSQQRRLAQLQRALQIFPQTWPSTPGTAGSNSWVIAPKRTKRGHALLANDTHMAIQSPNFWHEVHLKSPSINVSGYAIPGLPGIVIGHNKQVAWGMTAGQSNAADVVQIQPQGEQFRLGPNTHQLHTIRPIVWVKKGPFYLPVFWQTFQRSPIGPVLPLSWGKKNQKLLVRWTAYHIDKPPLELMDLMTAQTAKEADEHLKKMTLPNLSAVLADTSGKIRFRQFGLVARRLHGIHGLVDGSDPKQRWIGFLKPHEMPSLANPKRGYVATANNHPFPETYPYFLGHAFDAGLRARRIEELIEQRKHTLKSLKKMQLDTQVPLARMVLPILLKHLPKDLTPREQQVVSLLKKWNGRADRELVAPTVFRTWAENVRRRLFAFDRVPRRGGKGYDYPQVLGLVRALQGMIPIYTKQSMEKEIADAFRSTLTQLTKEMGKDPQIWLWGNVHRISFHSVLGKHSPFHPPSQGANGDFHTLNVATHGKKLPFDVQYGPTVRFLIELGPTIRSFGVMSGPQIDRHPTKLTQERQRWLNGTYRKRFFSPKDIKSNLASTETIRF